MVKTTCLCLYLKNFENIEISLWLLYLFPQEEHTQDLQVWWPIFSLEQLGQTKTKKPKSRVLHFNTLSTLEKTIGLILRLG